MSAILIMHVYPATLHFLIQIIKFPENSGSRIAFYKHTEIGLCRFGYDKNTF